MFKTIQEGAASISVPVQKKISKDMEVFYNPTMMVNRDFSILVLNTFEKENLNISLPLAGSGARPARFVKELKKNKIKEMYINDIDENAVQLIKKNVKAKNIHITQKDANIAILEQMGYDYIDIDPFGSPNQFLASAALRLSRGAILAVTATDTAALAGTYKKTGMRKYWGEGIRNYLMHEIGLRMLIRKVQLIGAQFEKALTPIVSYTHEHYMKIFFVCNKGKKKCDEILKQHKYFLFCFKCTHTSTSELNEEYCICKNRYVAYGPIYTGEINNTAFLKKMKKNVTNHISLKTQELLDSLIQESQFTNIGFYAPAGQAKYLKTKQWIKFEKIKEQLEKKKYKFCLTHMQKMAFRTDAPFKTVMKTVFNN